MHAEALEPPLRGPADRAEADDAGGATRQLPRAVALVGDLAARVHLAGAHVVVGGHDEAVGREQQRDRHLGDRVGVAARCAQHRDPGLGGGGDVDVVGVAAARPDQLQRQVEHRALHGVGLDDEDVGAFVDEARRELLAVVQAQRDLLDPRVVHDVGHALSVSLPSPRNGAVTSALGRSAHVLILARG